MGRSGAPHALPALVCRLLVCGTRGAAPPLALLAAADVALVLPVVAAARPCYLSRPFSTMAGIYAISVRLNARGPDRARQFRIAGFFSIGAFASALFTTTMPQGALAAYSQQAFGLGWPMIAGVLMAGVVAAAAGFLVSIPVLRLRTDFLAIATLGIAEVIRFIFQNERWLANGPQPMRGIPRPFDCVFADPACSWLPGSIVRFVAPLGPRDYVFLYLVVVQSSSQWSFCCSSASRLPWALQRAVRDSNSAAMDGRTCRWPDRVLRAGHFIMGIAGAFTPITWSHRLQPSTALCHLHRLGDGDAGEPRQQQGAILALRGWGVWSGGLHDRLRRARDSGDLFDLPSRGGLFALDAGGLMHGLLCCRPQGIYRGTLEVSISSPTRYGLKEKRRQACQRRPFLSGQREMESVACGSLSHTIERGWTVGPTEGYNAEESREIRLIANRQVVGTVPRLPIWRLSDFPLF